jgi:uncharacterized membrane protein YidH (DUF202 family)
MQILFFTRLVLYLLVFGLPIIHPSIAVPYDRNGLWMWFFLVPGEMLISFYLWPPRFRIRTALYAGAGLLCISILLFSGFSSYTFLFVGAALAAFILTVLIFKTGPRGNGVAILEQFALVFLYYKLLNFSRSSESVARESSSITLILFILIVCTFFLHGMVLYLSAFHQERKRGRLRELFLFFALAVPVVMLVVILLPKDFVTHPIVFNILKPEPKPEPIPLNEYGEGVEGGNLMSIDPWSDQRRGGDGSAGGLEEDGAGDQQEGEGSDEGQGFLEGIPSDQWFGQGSGQGGEDKQYAVMIIASSIEPVYAADGYYGDFDPQRGFLISSDQKLNDLTYTRLLETWQEQETVRDLKRYPQEIFYLSTLPDRVLAYKPNRIEPTVLNRKYHPFDFTYNTVSMISWAGLQDWRALRGLSAGEKVELRGYLEINLPEGTRESFQSHLESAVRGKTGYFEKVQAIFESFSIYQYELGFTDDVSVAHIENFLVDSKSGDCTEFSNTAAILARMAGVPSRVVTGWLAADELQSVSHRRGIRLLREVIEPLQDFQPHELFLVTSAHRHSWVQLYMPGYGWVDFDPTSFGIPPVGGAGFGDMNVVIPLIQIEEEVPTLQFPWMLMIRAFLFLAVVVLMGLYLFRYGMELHLKRLAGGKDEGSLRALYTLLLMRLGSNGYPLKNPSTTALEYASAHPELERFADLYTTLRYRSIYELDRKKKLWHEIRASYQEAVSWGKKPGILGALKRFTSLRGLYYRW